MVERIRLLLEARQLSPTQFADAIGIARPIVSHILSGRNKPSLEVVQRLLAAMPDLSMAWLLNGTGPMLAAELPAPSGPGQDLGKQAAAQSEAPLDAPEAVVNQNIKHEKTRPAATTGQAGSRKASSLGNTPVPQRFAPKHTAAGSRSHYHIVAEAVESVTAPPDTSVALPLDSAPVAPAPAPEPNPTAQMIAGSEKPIRRIVIFYRDGSFADYQPE